MIAIFEYRAVDHQIALSRERRPSVDGGNALLQRKCGDAPGVTLGEAVGKGEYRIVVLTCNVAQRRFQLRLAVHREIVHLQAERVGGKLRSRELLVLPGMLRIREQRDALY